MGCERSMQEDDFRPRASRDGVERPIGPEFDGPRLFHIVGVGRSSFRECDGCNASEGND